MLCRSRKPVLRTAVRLGIASILVACPLPSLLAQQANVPATVSATKTQLTQWHESLKNYAPLADGCYHTAYPSVQWEKVACGAKRSVASPAKGAAIAKAAAKADGAHLPLATVGNGYDYVAQTAGITRSSHGSFPVATGITSEKSKPTPIFPNGGIYGPNEYSLQLNTDIDPSSVACSAFGYSKCYVWEQFLYSTAGDGYPNEIFIQDWTFPSPSDYEHLGCPTGWYDASSPGFPACVANSDGVVVPGVLPEDLSGVELSGSVSSGRNTVIFSVNGDAYSVSELDSTVHLSAWWKQSEFNVVGNAGGAEAIFNSGTDIKVKIVVHDGSTNAPTCVPDSGSTGESNNLNSGPCSTKSGESSSISFTESN